MNNVIEITMKILLIVMMSTFCLNDGSLQNAMRGEKFQKLQYDPLQLSKNK